MRIPPINPENLFKPQGVEHPGKNPEADKAPAQQPAATAEPDFAQPGAVENLLDSLRQDGAGQLHGLDPDRVAALLDLE